MHYLSILFMKSMNFSLLSNNFVPQNCKSTNHVLIFTFSVLLTYFLITTYSKIIFRKYTLVVRNLWLVEKNMSKINFLRRTLKSTWNLLECSGLLGKLKKWKKKPQLIIAGSKVLQEILLFSLHEWLADFNFLLHAYVLFDLPRISSRSILG